MNRIFSLILVPLLIAPFSGAFGQANFREGYIITTGNDTLYGLIKDGYTPRNSKLCIFKESRKADAVKYYPEDLKAYHHSGGKYYASKDVTVKGEKKQVFTRVLLEGDINLYHQRKDKEYSYYMEKKEGDLIPLVNRDREYVRQSNWTYTGYRTYAESKIPEYKDTLYDLFSDSRLVQSQVNSVRYTDKSFMDITRDYVDATCQGGQCISYENDLKRTRERFGAYSGVFFSRIYFDDSGARSSLKATVPLGIYYTIPLTFISDRLSFQNELMYRWIEYDPLYNIPNETIYEKLKWDVVGVPLSLQYRISVKRVSPTIGFGKELGFVVNSDIVAVTEGKFPEDDPIVTNNEFLYKYQHGGWFLDLGCDFELNSSISLFSNIRIQHYQNKVIADQYENKQTFKVAEGTIFDSYSVALYFGVRF